MLELTICVQGKDNFESGKSFVFFLLIDRTDFVVFFLCCLCQPVCSIFGNCNWLRNYSIFTVMGRRNPNLLGGRPSFLHVPFSLNDKSTSDSESQISRQKSNFQDSPFTFNYLPLKTKQ